MKKKIIIAIVAILTVGGAIFLYSARDLIWYKYLSGKIMGEYEALVNDYKNDTYGGDTPEETLAMFVAALKAGDAKLASNYFVPEKRKESLKDIKTIMNNGRITDVINQLESYENKTEYDNGMFFSFSTFYEEEGGYWSETILFKNEHTGTWLIRDL